MGAGANGSANDRRRHRGRPAGDADGVDGGAEVNGDDAGSTWSARVAPRARRPSSCRSRPARRTATSISSFARWRPTRPPRRSAQCCGTWPNSRPRSSFATSTWPPTSRRTLTTTARPRCRMTRSRRIHSRRRRTPPRTCLRTPASFEGLASQDDAAGLLRALGTLDESELAAMVLERFPMEMAERSAAAETAPLLAAERSRDHVESAAATL